MDSETIALKEHYVYTLAHPETNEVFYVGKGQGERALPHEKDAMVSQGDSEKLVMINQIQSEGRL